MGLEFPIKDLESLDDDELSELQDLIEEEVVDRAQPPAPPQLYSDEKLPFHSEWVDDLGLVAECWQSPSYTLRVSDPEIATLDLVNNCLVPTGRKFGKVWVYQVLADGTEVEVVNSTVEVVATSFTHPYFNPRRFKWTLH
jgi:hypothetical protein